MSATTPATRRNYLAQSTFRKFTLAEYHSSSVGREWHVRVRGRTVPFG
jgi:hypothetical protein